MAPNPSAALRLALAVALSGALPAGAVTPEQARSLDFSSIFSPAQSVLIRALNSDKAFLDAFYPEFEKAKADEAAKKTADVQAFAEKWRGVLNQKAQALFAQDLSDKALFPPTQLKGLEKQLFDVIYLEGDVAAHTASVPRRQLGTPEGDPNRDVEIIARNRVAIRSFLAYAVSQPGGALGSAEKDWEALRAAMTESNKAGTLVQVQGWLAATSPKGAPPAAAPTPEPKKADFERVFGKEQGSVLYARFQAELKALDPKAAGADAGRRRLIEEWQGRLNKGPLEARVGLVFQSAVERAAAEFLAKGWGGKTGAEAEEAFSLELDKALRGDAASRSAILGAARKAVADHLKKDADPPGFKEHLARKGVTRDSLLAFYCAVGTPAAGTPETGAAGARAQADAAAARGAEGRTAAEDTARGADFTNKETGAASGSAPPPGGDIDPALASECGKWKAGDVARRENAAEEARRRTAAAQTNIAGEAVGAPPTTPDAEKPDTSAADAKKKKDLQRAAIGGMGGALVLGVFGFIFGGPIGAIAMGAVGFGVMAGVSYLNNNPIK